MSFAKKVFVGFLIWSVTAALSFVAGQAVCSYDAKIEQARFQERTRLAQAELNKEIQALQKDLKSTKSLLSKERLKVKKELTDEDKQALDGCIVPADALGLHERFRFQADRASDGDQ